jgi:eukaryotic-like serine/threonine-protein kinase
MPRVLGRYAIFDVLASGGMAQVHLGTLKGAGGYARIVAIKRLHPHLATNPDFLAMFIDEARLATRVRHANVVPTLDVVAEDGELFVVMEYVHGETFARLLKTVGERKERAPLGIVSAIVCDALHGLHAAHEAEDELGRPLGIVHRDVSPQNVLVGTDGTARVADFGVAKAAGRLQSTRDGELKGKLSYMAPEQLMGGVVDRRTDIYAAAVMLWQAATGQRLIASDNEGEVVARILDGKFLPPSEAAADTNLAPLDAITSKGMAHSANERYANAREMADALADVVPPTPRAQVGEWVARVASEELAARAALIHASEARGVANRPAEAQQLVDEVRSSPRVADEATKSAVVPGGTESRISNMTVGQPRHARRARRGVWALGLIAAVAMASIAGWRGLRSPAKVPAVDAGATAGGAKAVTDWPLPDGPPDAVGAYKAALEAMRFGARNDMERELRRAVALDPTLGAAHLRISLAARLNLGMESERRQAFKHALQFKDKLTERDKLLVDAFEPYIARDPTDPRETVRRLVDLAARYPNDAEIAYYVGTTESDIGKFPEAVTAFSRATALDPAFARASAAMADTQGYAGDLEGALRTTAKCLAVRPVATECSRVQFLIHRVSDCSALEADAKRALTVDAEDADGYWFLTEALVAQERPRTVVQEAFDQWARRQSPDAKAYRLRKQLWFDLNFGDVVAASAHLDDWEGRVRDNPNVFAHAPIYRYRIAIEEERGRPAIARQIAARFIERYDMWLRPTAVDDAGMWQDRFPWILGVLLRLGGISYPEFAQRRDAWVRRWRSTASGSYVGYIWVYAYATSAQTRESALDAIAAIESFAPLPTVHGDINADAFVGRMYLVAGRPKDAIEPLRRASAMCRTILNPVDQMGALSDLAAAYEAAGQNADACAAWERVLKRWAAGTPKLTSAERARARLAALSCPR